MSELAKSSSVVTFLEMVYDQSEKATSHSRERINHAMQQALRLAIGAGFKWELEDFKTLATSKWFCYAIGESSENLYSAAIVEGNLTAAQSYEAWKDREPFIADNVSLGHGPRFCHSAGDRAKERLAEGFQFPWKGQRVTVTSFAADGKSLTACSYKPRKENDYSNKVDKRYRITREDIIADRADRKTRAAYLERLNKYAGSNGESGKIMDLLGIKTRGEYATMPLKRIEKVLAKLEAEAKP